MDRTTCAIDLSIGLAFRFTGLQSLYSGGERMTEQERYLFDLQGYLVIPNALGGD